MNNKEPGMMGLNTVQANEYQHWMLLLNGVCSIQEILKLHPNVQGLDQARSVAYNVLADIQILMDSLHKQDKE